MSTSKNNLVKTAIVDKNGKATHVHKKDEAVTNGRRLPTTPYDKRISREGFSATRYSALKDILRKHLDRDKKLIIFDDEFVDHFLKPDALNEYWMSNGVHEMKLMGRGTNMEPFYITTRSANKQFLESVDAASAEIASLFGHATPAKIAPQEIDSSVQGTSLHFTLASGEEVYFDPEISSEEPVSHIDPSFSILPNGNIRGVWAVNDEDPFEYEFMEGDSLEEFRSEDARDTYIKEKIASGVPEDHIFIVDKYSHSGVSYSVHDTKTYPDHNWDTAPSNVLILDADSANKNLGGVIDIEAAQSTLDNYTSYANGDVYGIAVAIFDKDGEITDEPEVSWGYIGTEYVEEMIKDDLF